MYRYDNYNMTYLNLYIRVRCVCGLNAGLKKGHSCKLLYGILEKKKFPRSSKTYRKEIICVPIKKVLRVQYL